MILHFFLTRGTAQLTWQLIYTSSFLVTVPLHFRIITPHISTPFQVDTVNTIIMFCPIQFYLLSDSSSCFPVCLVPCRLCTYTCGQKNMQMLNIFMCEHDSPCLEFHTVCLRGVVNNQLMISNILLAHRESFEQNIQTLYRAFANSNSSPLISAHRIMFALLLSQTLARAWGDCHSERAA